MKKIVIVLAGWLLAMGLAFAQVNINTAKLNQLDGLKGIGPTKAQAIIDYRKKNGRFKSVDDLLNVPGIGPETLDDLRSEVKVSGASRPVLEAPAARKAEPVAKKSEAAAPAMPKAAAPVSAAPAKPAMPSFAPAKPATPAAPALPGKVPAEAKAAASAVPAAPARPAQPARPAAY